MNETGPHIKRYKLLEFDDGNIWNAVRSWQILRPLDNSDDDDDVDSEQHLQTSANEHEKGAALHISKLVQGSMVGSNDTYKARQLYSTGSHQKTILNTNLETLNRKQPLREVSNLFKEAATVIKETSNIETNYMSEIMKVQHSEGKLLTADTTDSLKTILESSTTEIHNRLSQTNSLLWTSLIKMFPKGSHNYHIFKVELYSFEIGLLPWSPNEVVFKGDSKEGKNGARAGFESTFAITGVDIPSEWVTNHLQGCIVDAVRHSEPHRKFKTADEFVEKGVSFLQHIGILWWGRSRCEKFGFSVSMSPLTYPCASQLVLSHPITCQVVRILVITNHTITIRDITATRAAVDLVIGCAALDIHLKPIAARYLK
eukprot:TRINITY_DN1154_c8_g1_i1.p1 TRINITY_DN1154_c8_g1~~TRINITY_DN1154_c8_g1_i1.p1  ORF type:complete len:399 (+),score=69.40 TRINITY_DN1154_c8_g1_i1:85-1197(+)